MYFVILGDESVSTNKIGHSDSLALSIIFGTQGSMFVKLQSLNVLVAFHMSATQNYIKV